VGGAGETQVGLREPPLTDHQATAPFARLRPLTLAVLVAVGGCGGREASSARLADAGDAQGGAVDSSAMDEAPEFDAPDDASVEFLLRCLIPTGLGSYDDGSNSGCRPMPAMQDCTFSSGAYFADDGAVENGTATCTTSCPPRQYYLACDGPLGTVGTAPSPDPFLYCMSIGGPTASNEQDYCCECVVQMMR
jgi:hypothetical protein